MHPAALCCPMGSFRSCCEHECTNTSAWVCCWHKNGPDTLAGGWEQWSISSVTEAFSSIKPCVGSSAHPCRYSHSKSTTSASTFERKGGNWVRTTRRCPTSVFRSSLLTVFHLGSPTKLVPFFWFHSSKAFVFQYAEVMPNEAGIRKPPGQSMAKLAMSWQCSVLSLNYNLQVSLGQTSCSKLGGDAVTWCSQ